MMSFTGRTPSTTPAPLWDERFPDDPLGALLTKSALWGCRPRGRSHVSKISLRARPHTHEGEHQDQRQDGQPHRDSDRRRVARRRHHKTIFDVDDYEELRVRTGGTNAAPRQHIYAYTTTWRMTTTTHRPRSRYAPASGRSRGALARLTRANSLSLASPSGTVSPT